MGYAVLKRDYDEKRRVRIFCRRTYYRRDRMRETLDERTTVQGNPNKLLLHFGHTAVGGAVFFTASGVVRQWSGSGLLRFAYQIFSFLFKAGIQKGIKRHGLLSRVNPSFFCGVGVWKGKSGSFSWGGSIPHGKGCRFPSVLQIAFWRPVFLRSAFEKIWAVKQRVNTEKDFGMCAEVLFICWKITFTAVFAALSEQNAQSLNLTFRNNISVCFFSKMDRQYCCILCLKRKIQFVCTVRESSVTG